MPPEHPEVVKNRAALAEVLARNGEYAKAAEQYGVLLKVYQRVMGVDAPETLSYQRSLSKMLGMAKETEVKPKREEAVFRQLYQKHSITLGKEEPQMLWIQSELVDQLMAQSKWEAAEGELRAMLEIERRVKEYNPADSMFKLALCLEAQDKFKESLAYVQEIERLKRNPNLAERMMTLRSRIEAKQKNRGAK